MLSAAAEAACVAEKFMHMNALNELFRASADTTSHP